MNILHIASNYPPEVGGPASSVPYLAEEQVRLGNNVFVLTHGAPKISKEGTIVVFRCGEIKGEVSSISSGLIKSMKMGLVGRRIIKEQKIDVIHAHDPNVSAIAKLIIDPRKRTPSVIKYSGDLAWELVGLKRIEQQNEKRFWNTKTAKTLLLIEKLFFSAFDKIIAQSKYQEDILANICNIDHIRIVRIPNGLKKYRYTKDQIRAAEEKLPSGLKIASACRLVPWKGLGAVIKAMKNIDGNYIIFGDGPEKKKLQKLTNEEGVEDKVLFFGKVPHQEVQLYLKACDLVILPSLYEPFGITILDAFAAGTPVIASNTGGIPEIIDERQLFDPNKADEIVEKINFALENKYSIIKNQTSRLDRYEWSKIAADVQKVYAELI